MSIKGGIMKAKGKRAVSLIRSLVSRWARDHVNRGGDYETFSEMLIAVAEEDGGTHGAAPLSRYLSMWAFQAVPEWQRAPTLEEEKEIDSLVTDLLEGL